VVQTLLYTGPMATNKRLFAAVQIVMGLALMATPIVTRTLLARASTPAPAVAAQPATQIASLPAADAYSGCISDDGCFPPLIVCRDSRCVPR
jgi:hypothetical protein